MGGKPRLSTLLNALEEAIAEFPDLRTGSNTSYLIRDAALSAFSVFFTQSPSFLAHQLSMQHGKGNNNARTIFGLHSIPSDNWIRTLLDPVPTSSLVPVFRSVFEQLHEQGAIDKFRAFDGNLLVAIDGTWFHSSESIHCRGCNHQEHRDGRITYYHSAITPVIVKPGSNHVLSLEPQFISPQDGAKKQALRERRRQALDYRRRAALCGARAHHPRR